MNAAPRTNTAAVISLVCGIASWVVLPFLAAIGAVVAGHIARSQIRKDPPQEGDGFAIAGLILGYLNLALALAAIALLVILVAVGINWH